MKSNGLILTYRFASRTSLLSFSTSLIENPVSLLIPPSAKTWDDTLRPG